jgi:hypothetical protein
MKNFKGDIIMKNIDNEKGAVAVIVVICLVLFLGVAAFTIDVGYLQYQKRHLQNTADAAALAGAAEYIGGDPSLENITEVVKDYVKLNGVDTSEVIKVTQSKIPNEPPYDEYNTVKVDLKGTRNIFFARIFGYQNSAIRASATAIAAPISGIDNLIPFAIEESAFNGLEEGDSFDLYSKFSKNKNDEDNDPGNWGTINFESSGSANQSLSIWTREGYQETVKIGDTVWTSPGAGLNSYPFKSALESRVSTEENPQFVVIPVVNDGVFSGSKPTNVLGFVVIEIKTAEIQGQEINVTAIYHEVIEIGDIDPNATNYGVQGLRLIE